MQSPQKSQQRSASSAPTLIPGSLVSKGTTREYEFPLNVPGRKIYEGHATVHEATMEVPYTMLLSIGGHEWELHGTWSGAAYSSVLYTVFDITPSADQDASAAIFSATPTADLAPAASLA